MKHDLIPTIQKEWFGQAILKKCTLSAPPSKGKHIVICHPGSTKGFAPNSLLLCGQKPSAAYADYHDDIDGEVFED